jgi:uncharacterized protein YigE (DUF2233 family)
MNLRHQMRKWAGWASLCLPLPVWSAEISTIQAEGKPMTVCLVDLKQDTLSLHLNKPDGSPWKQLAPVVKERQARGKKVWMAMNAGMYHADFKPVGLFVMDGAVIAPLNTANGEGNFFLQPNGVFFLAEGNANVWETSRYAKTSPKATLATQSGPLLLENGKVHPAFTKGSSSAKIRNGVGVVSATKVAFVISRAPINLYDFAEFFRSKLGCKDALYMDGTISCLTAPDSNVELSVKQGRDVGPIFVVEGN